MRDNTGGLTAPPPWLRTRLYVCEPYVDRGGMTRMLLAHDPLMDSIGAIGSAVRSHASAGKHAPPARLRCLLMRVRG